MGSCPTPPPPLATRIRPTSPCPLGLAGVQSSRSGRRAEPVTRPKPTLAGPQDAVSAGLGLGPSGKPEPERR